MTGQIIPAQAEKERELKTAFAEALLKSPDKPFEAALTLPIETGIAMQIATKWQHDPFVISEKLRLIEAHGAQSFLPSKAEQLKDLWKMATETKDDEIRIKAHRLYAEIANHIEKPSEAKVQIVNQNVMIVKDHGNDDDWERGAVKQQRELISHATVS